MLQALRQRLTLILLCLLPFHAFLVTVLTKVMVGPVHAPLPVLAVWKEALLGVTLGIAVTEVMISAKQWLVGSRQWLVFFKKIDALDVIILASLLLSIAIFITHYPLSTIHFIYGFKYDFLPLIAFLILRRVPWGERWLQHVQISLILVGSIVSAYGLLTLFLPDSFFSWLGYSNQHSLYFANSSLSAFQHLQASDLRRVQSVLSGPNQLGLWLLIPLGMVLGSWSPWKVVSFLLILLAIIGSFSRAAWIAAIVMTMVVYASSVAKERRRKIVLRSLTSVVGFAIALVFLFPSVVGRMGSSSDHLRKPVEAMRLILMHPFGLGLGSAGPASNALSDSCVFLRPQDDPSWAKATPALCVFVGGKQVQPSLPSGELRPAGQLPLPSGELRPAGQSSHSCSCPLLTENWYLQWGVEMGWLGLLLSVMLPCFVFRKWFVVRGSWSEKLITSHLLLTTLLSFLGLSIAALFLHAFEDSAVAYSMWILLAMKLPPTRR